MDLTLEQIDKNLTLALNNLDFKLGDCFWQFMSDVRIWIPFYLTIITLLFIRLGWRKASVVLLATVLTIVACDQTANVFKGSFERLRPCYDHWMLSHGVNILEKRSGFFGFFSAHSANAFGLAVCTFNGLRKNDISHSYRKYGWLMFIWAALVAVSRIFVGKHFLGDVIVGAAMGLIIGYAFSFVGNLAIRRYLR